MSGGQTNYIGFFSSFSTLNFSGNLWHEFDKKIIPETSVSINSDKEIIMWFN